MFVCTFRYRPKHVACYLCTEYKQKQGCTLPVCPWLAERIEAGVVGYQEAVMATIPRNRLLAPRLRALVASFPGSLWKDGTHKERMEYAKTRLHYMVEFEVLEDDNLIALRGETARLFLSEQGYQKVLHSQELGKIHITDHALVVEGHIIRPKRKKHH